MSSRSATSATGNSRSNSERTGTLYNANNGTSGSRTRRTIRQSEDSNHSEKKQKERTTNMNFRRDQVNNSNINGEANSESENIDNSQQHPMKLLRTLLRQFDTGEKRQWPNYLKDLTKLFIKCTNAKDFQKRSVIEDVTKVYSRILTTKLFPDIINEVVNCMSEFSYVLCFKCNELFDWIFKMYREKSDDTRLVLLKALTKIIERGGKGVAEHVSNLASRVRRLLEDTDTNSLLLGITDVLLAISRIYKEQFAEHFQDIVDFLIGWMVDLFQNSAMVKKLNDALIAMSYYWIDRMDISLRMLVDLRDDFEASYQALVNEQNIYSRPNSLLRSFSNENINQEQRMTKMASLIGVYSTVFKSLKEYASPAKNFALTWDTIIETLNLVMEAVTYSFTIKKHEHLVIVVNEIASFVLELTSGTEDSVVALFSSELISYTELVLSQLSNSSEQYTISSLQLAVKLVKQIGTNLPVEFVSMILSSNSECQKLRFLPSGIIQKHLYELHHSLLGIKNVPLLEEAYRCFLAELQITFSQVLSDKVVIINSDSECASKYDTEGALIAVASTIASLTELADSKNSVITMWALKPTLFELIVIHLSPVRESLFRYPKIQMLLLELLQSHCSSHHQFVTWSELFKKSSSSGNAIDFNAMISHPTSGYLAKIFQLLNKLLRTENLTNENRLVCVKWTKRLIEEINTQIQLLSSNHQFRQLLIVISSCTFSKSTAISAESCCIMVYLIEKYHHLLPEACFGNCHEACLLHMSHSDQKVRSEYVNLFKKLPISFDWSRVARDFAVANRDNFVYPSDVLYATSILMKKDTSTAFSAVAFKELISFLLDGKEMKGDDWLKTLQSTFSEDNVFKTAQTGRNLSGKGTENLSEQNFLEILQHNERPVIFWVTWETVEYCIANKLKTTLGDAQLTLTKIHNALQRLAQKYYNSESEELNVNQVQMMILFMENLDKLMYNAIEGSSIMLYSPSKVSRTFFRTNQATCTAWMTRNRKSIMMLALKNHDWATVWRHGEELLKDMLEIKAQASELYPILAMIVEALVHLRCSDAISGYYAWSKSLGINLVWLKPAIDEAKNKFESAIKGYRHYWDSKISNKQDVRDEFINKRMIESYESVNCWEDAVKWANKSKLNESGIFGVQADLSYLTSFSHGDEPKSDVSVKSLALDDVIHQYTGQVLKRLIANDKTTEASSNSLELILEAKLGQNGIDSRLSTLLHINDNTSKLQCKILPEYSTTSYLQTSELSYLMRWSKFIEVERHSELLMLQSKTARRQQNLNLSVRSLLAYCKDFMLVSNSKAESTRSVSDISPLITTLKSLSSENLNSEKKFEVLNEGSKLLKSFGDTRSAIDVIVNELSTPACKMSEKTQCLFSKSLISLAKLFQNDMKYLEHHDELGSLDFVKKPATNGLGCQVLLGDLLSAATDCCPQSAKAWLTLADWYYRKERRIIDLEDETGGDQLDVKDEVKQALNLNAVNAYFKFLHINDPSQTNQNVLVTLRLLRLIANHSSEFEDAILAGVDVTPTGPWKNIIVQLFARLSATNDEFVKQAISKLLCKIGKESPHMIVFPAVAGSLATKESRLMLDVKLAALEIDSSQVDEDEMTVESDEEEKSERAAAVKNSTFSSLVDVLTSYDPQLISQTIQFISEMRRITILWDELWLGTLLSRQAEMVKKVNALEEEIKRARKKSQFATESELRDHMKVKYESYLQKLITCTEEMQSVTCDSIPETPYEKWFQATFGRMIPLFVETLKNPSDYLAPQQSLSVYQQLIQQLRKRSMELSSGRSQLIMDTISPLLSSMSESAIAIPGLNSKEVTIQRVHKTVTILHTKTKPKKVAFYGSTGQLHSFLFKGHEDLRLDERVMQFLSICNKLFAKVNRKTGKNLHARNYSVTPLGTKNGLIQWVDSVPPLYGFYKRWMMSKQALSKPGTEVSYKPSEIFNKKLSGKNLSLENRRDWPVRDLVQIHKELVEETSGNLLTKELWCAAVSANDYWKLTQNFATSNAVMGIIGYVIGLGDRHLDNVLLDLSTGDIIHVDYNVCFEKGKSLRVPERVPFRLTQNMVNAFGITGVEGTFRISCEQVLNVMRTERETLLMLLEAFVSDPLVDWTSVNESGNNKKSQGKKYATQMWRRIKMKLDGRDPDPSTKASVAEQVDYVIKEATNVESLALMYEGWTSWV
ncbi:Serine/threonine-protein kinase SMG1 [Halotydeus destructor]|nr:Serine/threonine-protein kinase SMG1 [Halotydeus destructor]